MIDRLILFAIQQRLFILLFVLFLIGGGIYSFYNLPIDAFPDPKLHIAHFHETKRIGSASVLASLQAGINRFEASLGGIAGQPANFFEDRPVPGTGKYYHVSPGIVPLEDLLVQVDEMGIKHGFDGAVAPVLL